MCVMRLMSGRGIHIRADTSVDLRYAGGVQRADPSQPLTLVTQKYSTPAGKWNKHVDAWDAVENNEFFSPEAWIFAFSQMFQVPASVTSTDPTHQPTAKNSVCLVLADLMVTSNVLSCFETSLSAEAAALAVAQVRSRAISCP